MKKTAKLGINWYRLDLIERISRLHHAPGVFNQAAKDGYRFYILLNHDEQITLGYHETKEYTGDLIADMESDGDLSNYYCKLSIDVDRFIEHWCIYHDNSRENYNVPSK